MRRMRGDGRGHVAPLRRSLSRLFMLPPFHFSTPPPLEWWNVERKANCERNASRSATRRRRRITIPMGISPLCKSCLLCWDFGNVARGLVRIDQWSCGCGARNQRKFCPRSWGIGDNPPSRPHIWSWTFVILPLKPQPLWQPAIGIPSRSRSWACSGAFYYFLFMFCRHEALQSSDNQKLPRFSIVMNHYQLDD